MLRIIYAIKALEYTSHMITAVIQRRHAKLYLDGHHFLQLMIFYSCFPAGTISTRENMFFRILLSLLPKPIAFCCQD
jgi:hypothetical protein